MDINSSSPVFNSVRTEEPRSQIHSRKPEKQTTGEHEGPQIETYGGETSADYADKVRELSRLSELEYEKRRETEAKALGVRVTVLDKNVKSQRDNKAGSQTGQHFRDVEAWPEPVTGAELLDEITATIRRFCITPEHSDVVMAAWVLHAWCHDAADISPILAFVSPEKRCGKTTALSVVGALVPKPMISSNASTAAIFRVVEKHLPTVLIDEADTYLADNNELRGILNGGHNRMSATIWRCAGDDHEPTGYNAWAPKCIAMIGDLPDTLADRALVVRLRRKRKGECVERFRADKLDDLLPLRRRAKRWADDNMTTLRRANPNIPDELNDRAQDNARHICAIADIAGGKWPEAVRTALVTLAARSDDEPQSSGLQLLIDISEILELRKGDSIKSAELCDALGGLEEAPWAEWRRGNPITPRGIAYLLKPYGIRPTRDRSGRYYRLSDFTDAIMRYVPDTATPSVTSDTSDTLAVSDTRTSNDIMSVTHDDACDAYPRGDRDQAAPAGDEGEF